MPLRVQQLLSIEASGGFSSIYLLILSSDKSLMLQAVARGSRWQHC